MKVIQCGYCGGDTPVYNESGLNSCTQCMRSYLVRTIENRLWSFPLGTDQLYVYYELIHPDAKPPYSWGSAYDLTIVEKGIVWPTCCRTFSTGLRLGIPEPLWVITVGMPGWFKRGLVVCTKVYGHDTPNALKVTVRNVGPWPVRVHVGDKLAIAVLSPLTLFAQHQNPVPFLKERP